VLLAVNTYFEIGDVQKVNTNNPLVIELSQTLRSLPIHRCDDETFRNISGTDMTLKCIAALDEGARYSMKTYTGLQKEIFYYYRTRQLILEKLCNAIKACMPLPFEYRPDLLSPCSITGNILFQYHLFIEQKSRTAKLTRTNSYQRRKSICQICGIDLYVTYGNSGIELLEQHYSEDIANYGINMNVLQGRFISICPICHKWAHLNSDTYLYNNLKQLIRK
jgi:hypothetical protein